MAIGGATTETNIAKKELQGSFTAIAHKCEKTIFFIISVNRIWFQQTINIANKQKFFGAKSCKISKCHDSFQQ